MLGLHMVARPAREVGDPISEGHTQPVRENTTCLMLILQSTSVKFLHPPPMQACPVLLPSPAERRLSSSSMYSRASEMVGAARDALLGPSRPRPHKIWKKRYIKLLVVRRACSRRSARAGSAPGLGTWRERVQLGSRPCRALLRVEVLAPPP